jgi:hypothetical protein
MDVLIARTPPGCPDLCSVSLIPQVLEASAVLLVLAIAVLALAHFFWRRSSSARGR